MFKQKIVGTSQLRVSQGEILEARSFALSVIRDEDRVQISLVGRVYCYVSSGARLEKMVESGESGQ